MEVEQPGGRGMAPSSEDHLARGFCSICDELCLGGFEGRALLP